MKITGTYVVYKYPRLRLSVSQTQSSQDNLPKMKLCSQPRSFPSSYVWHIYLTVFCLHSASHRSRVLANTFRVVQAFSMSLPLILLNIYTLLSVLHKDDENLDLSRLIDHLTEGINGNCPCPPSVIGNVER